MLKINSYSNPCSSHRKRRTAAGLDEIRRIQSPINETLLKEHGCGRDVWSFGAHGVFITRNDLANLVVVLLRRLGLEGLALHHDCPGDARVRLFSRTNGVHRLTVGKRHGNQARRLLLEQSQNPGVVRRRFPV